MRSLKIRVAVGCICIGIGFFAVQRCVDAGTFTEVSISSVVNADLSTYTRGDLYPAGGNTLTIGGVDFILAAGPGNSRGPGIFQTDTSDPARISATIPVNVFGVGTVYTLVNSIFGELGNDNGTIEFKGTGGADAVFHFVQGTNIRDHFQGLYNNVIDPSIPNATFIDPTTGDEVRLDRQAFVLPSTFATETLTDIVFTGFNGFPNFSPGQPFIAAVTVETVPEPASIVTWMLAGAVATIAAWRRRRQVLS